MMTLWYRLSCYAATREFQTLFVELAAAGILVRSGKIYPYIINISTIPHDCHSPI